MTSLFSIMRDLIPAVAPLLVWCWMSIPAMGRNGSVPANSIGMEFVLIPAGSFQMGSPLPRCLPDDPRTEKNEYTDCLLKTGKDEMPCHQVEISRAYYLGKYEVTQDQWYRVMGTDRSEWKSDQIGGNFHDYPMERVSWEDCQAFIFRLNVKEGTNSYRLPTEAEWEYAARAGMTGERYGDPESNAWCDENSDSRPHPVGSKMANPWGLFDMLGNVREWCQDWYGQDYYSRSPSVDPSGPPLGSDRVCRGGSWFDFAEGIRFANRTAGIPTLSSRNLGFRLVRDL